jgi:TRAP-type mannitol/chloroaromatic compound transport system permease small subunit
MRWIDQKLLMISENFSLCGGALILISAFMVTIEVFLRKIVGVSIGGADELSGYALGIGSSWAFALTLITRANIRVDALYMFFPKSIRALLDFFALVTLGVVLSICSVFVYEVLFESIELGSNANTPLSTPLWIPQSLWFSGFVMFLIVFAYQTFITAIALLKGDIAGVQRIIGARTVADDIKDEIGETPISTEKEA